MSDEQKVTFFGWIIANLGLPLAPLIIKILICIFSKVKVNIFDSIELILYSFFICIILIDITSQQNNVYGKMLNTVLIIFCIIDIVLMVLLYLNIGNIGCIIYALVMAITTPVFAFMYKRKEIIKSGGEKI